MDYLSGFPLCPFHLFCFLEGSGKFDGHERFLPKRKGFRWQLPFRDETIYPSYLPALTAGDLVYTSLSDRAVVYAEPELIEQAAREFIDIEKMVSAAEALYGPYRWEQFDILVLPPSFPFRGMGHPRLVFATTTMLSGDRSLVSLVAHELAHSRSGNLVTNATWNDFWLNERFTVYFERRIMEKIEGSSFSDMLIQTGYLELQNTLNELGYQNQDTCLKLKLKDSDPDDGMTMIAYEKGFFMQSVEHRKFLMSLYKSLLKTETGKSLASSIYKKARPNYHYIATASIDALFV